MCRSYQEVKGQLIAPAVNRQLPIGRVDEVDANYLEQVDKVDAIVDAIVDA